MGVAVRRALDYQSTGRAVGVGAIGFRVQLLLRLMIVSFAGTPQA